MTMVRGLPESVPVAIIGAGPAGLATAACLKREGVEALILERENRIGPSWRRHYRRLHLHTVKRYSALPHHPWPRHVPRYPSRRQVVDYLESYADAFGLAPRFGAKVVAAEHDGSAWRIESDGGLLRAEALVVATGYNRRPHLPDFPGRQTFRGEVLHSSRYWSGEPWRDKRVMVIGFGNSGAEIAIDLWEQGAREVSIAVRSPVHVVPRDLMGLPAQVTALLSASLPVDLADRMTMKLVDRLHGDLRRYGIKRPALGPRRMIVDRGRVPVLDVGTVELIKKGLVEVVGGVERFDETGVVLEDGSERPLDAVVLATGYRAAIDEYLDGSDAFLDARGYPLKFGEEMSPGLFFVGYRNPPTGQLHDISLEAPRVARAIARKA